MSVCITAISYSAIAAPNPAALDLVGSMCHPTRVGVDRRDAFWSWDAVDGIVSRTTPDGERVTVNIDEDVAEMDADSDRGIVILGKSENTIRVMGWDGKITSSFHLPFAAGSVAWMDADQIGLGPRTAPWLAEVWSIERKERVLQIGPVPEIGKPKVGAVPVRSTLLRYDGSRRQLLIFDAFEGDLFVFSADGSVDKRATIVHPDLDANRAFLRRLDIQARQAGGSSMPRFSNYARIAITNDGSVWLGERTPEASSVIIAKIAPTGEVSREKLNVPECNSVRFELWQGQLILFRDPGSPLKQCVTIKRERR